MIMQQAHSLQPPHWYYIPARVLLLTFLLTLLCFAVSLLLGILGLVVAGRIHGVHPNMTVAYRQIALPAAGVVAVLSVICLSVVEIRNFRQNRALAQIARASQ